ncbi:MAG: sulfite oxidase heme-binding subunit YedZ, partial [Paracoccus sp. (in: a-proteobacteria)]
MQPVNRLLRRIPEWAVWLLGALPLALLVLDTLSGQLGIDPVRDIEHRLGRTAFYFLIASLAVTPLRRLTRINAFHMRRALGLLSFSYALLHIASWALFDMGLLWGQMLSDLLKRPYLFLGMAGFVILLALAVTSNRASIRKLGRNWHRLHRAVYVAAVLIGLHWLLALKIVAGWPVVCVGALLILLAL